MGLFNKKKEEPKSCGCGGTGASERTAEAPKAELMTYATTLRAMTQGRGKFTETFARYEEAPATVLQSLKK